MKIFGREFTTKKELRETIDNLKCEFGETVSKLQHEITNMKSMFPFVMGQTVYDIQFRNESGRYAKKNISFEHSLINEVVVNEKNYFGLVERYQNHDVFIHKSEAEMFLRRAAIANEKNNI